MWLCGPAQHVRPRLSEAVVTALNLAVFSRHLSAELEGRARPGFAGSCGPPEKGGSLQTDSGPLPRALMAPLTSGRFFCKVLSEVVTCSPRGGEALPSRGCVI